MFEQCTWSFPDLILAAILDILLCTVWTLVIQEYLRFLPALNTLLHILAQNVLPSIVWWVGSCLSFRYEHQHHSLQEALIIPLYARKNSFFASLCLLDTS